MGNATNRKWKRVICGVQLQTEKGGPFQEPTISEEEEEEDNGVRGAVLSNATGLEKVNPMFRAHTSCKSLFFGIGT